MKFTATVLSDRTIMVTDEMLEATKPYGGCYDRSGLYADFILALPGINIMANFDNRFDSLRKIHVPYSPDSILTLKFNPFDGQWFSIENVIHGPIARRINTIA